MLLMVVVFGPRQCSSSLWKPSTSVKVRWYRSLPLQVSAATMRYLRKSIPPQKYPSLCRGSLAAQLVRHALDLVPRLDNFRVHLIAALRLDHARELIGHVDIGALECAGNDQRGIRRAQGDRVGPARSGGRGPQVLATGHQTRAIGELR